jgi:putative tricarboxylic transport membrane protein
MRAADLITAAALMGLGGVVIHDAARLGVGWGADGPKSGFFPFWLATIMMVTCAVIALKAWRSGVRTPFVTRERLRPVLTVLAPAVAAVVLMQAVGLYVASAVYMAFYMRWVGRHSWSGIVLVGVGVPVVTFFIFEHWFLVPLPKGPVEHWLGY